MRAPRRRFVSSVTIMCKFV